MEEGSGTMTTEEYYNTALGALQDVIKPIWSVMFFLLDWTCAILLWIAAIALVLLLVAIAIAAILGMFFSVVAVMLAIGAIG